MTREEQTISNLKKLKSFHNGSYGTDIDRAIKALEQDCDTCEVGNPCMYCKHEFEPLESEVSDADNNNITRMDRD